MNSKPDLFRAFITKLQVKCTEIIGDLYFDEEEQVGFYKIQGISTAANKYNNGTAQVKVSNFFDDFWIYIEIRFIKAPIEEIQFKKKDKEDYLQKNYICFGKDYYSTNITLSLFQGKEEDNDKFQLFRAEWDGYMNTPHPQPHWHFYPFYTEEASDENGIVDVRKIHFAMNEQWVLNKNYLKRINNENILIEWFMGVLTHIKEQLEYVSD